MSKVAWSTSHSPGHDARYDRSVAAEALRSARLAPGRDEPVDAGRDRSAGDATAARRPHPLVSAMVQAVQGLRVAPDAAAPDAPGAGADTSPAPVATTLEAAAVTFAQELLGTLGEIADRSARHYGPRGHAHAYGRLAHRLEALASRLEAAAPAPATGADPVSAPVPEVLQPVDTATRTPATADAASVRITIEFTLPRDTSTPQESRLKTAFEDFVRALNPGAAQPSESGATPAPATADLASFLRSIAQALRSNGPAADTHASMAGSLVNLTA